MERISVILLFSLLLAGCSTSPYVGSWQKDAADGKTTYDLILNEDGSLIAKWHDGTQYVTRSGTWKEESDGSITLDGINTSATAKMQKNKLILTTQNNLKHHFIREVVKKAYKP